MTAADTEDGGCDWTCWCPGRPHSAAVHQQAENAAQVFADDRDKR